MPPRLTRGLLLYSESLRLPRMPTLATPIHSLIASDKAGKEAVATGCGGDGGGTATRAFEGLVFFKEKCLLYDLILCSRDTIFG